MPSTSKKQHNFMAAVANNPAFAKKAGVPQSVGKEFNNADKGKTFKQGGDMKSEAMKKGGMPMKMKDGKKVPIFMKKGGVAASPMGKVKTASPSKDGVATKGKTKGTMIAMAKGGKAMKSGGKAC
jgi:hypothetical protein